MLSIQYNKLLDLLIKNKKELEDLLLTSCTSSHIATRQLCELSNKLTNCARSRWNEDIFSFFRWTNFVETSICCYSRITWTHSKYGGEPKKKKISMNLICQSFILYEKKKKIIIFRSKKKKNIIWIRFYFLYLRVYIWFRYILYL